jgi:hypothetical protein
MGEYANQGHTLPCKWCGRPVNPGRRFFPRRYCNRRHKWKHRFTELFGEVLGGGA